MNVQAKTTYYNFVIISSKSTTNKQKNWTAILNEHGWILARDTRKIHNSLARTYKQKIGKIFCGGNFFLLLVHGCSKTVIGCAANIGRYDDDIEVTYCCPSQSTHGRKIFNSDIRTTKLCKTVWTIRNKQKHGDENDFVANKRQKKNVWK